MFDFNFKADFNGDGLTDILWRGADGSYAFWNMDASGLGGSLGGTVAPPVDWKLLGVSDTTANGTSDMLFQDAGGLVHAWNFINNAVATQDDLINQTRLPITALGDFDGNGHSDMLYYMPPASPFGGVPGTWATAATENRKIPPAYLGDFPPTSLDYKFSAIGDLDGNGRDDLLLRGTGGPGARNFILQEPTGEQPTNGTMPVKTAFISDPGRDWQVMKLADFNGDGKDDILWQHDSGAHGLWTMDGGNVISMQMIADPGREWSLVAAQDYNNDGKTDLMWHHTSGWNCEWLMNGAEIQSFGASIYLPGDYWSVVG